MEGICAHLKNGNKKVFGEFVRNNREKQLCGESDQKSSIKFEKREKMDIKTISGYKHK